MIKSKEEIKNFLLALRLIEGEVKNMIVFKNALIVNRQNQENGSITNRYIVIKVAEDKYFYSFGVSSIQYGYMSKRQPGKLIRMEKKETTNARYEQVISKALDQLEISVPLMVKVKVFAIIRAIMRKHRNGKPETVEYFSKERFLRYCLYVLSASIGGASMPLEPDIERYAKEAFLYFQNRFKNDEIISRLSCPDDIFQIILRKVKS